MVLGKPKKELIETTVSQDTMCENTKADLGSKGQTMDFSRERHLSGLYNKRNSSRIGLI